MAAGALFVGGAAVLNSRQVAIHALLLLKLKSRNSLSRDSVSYVELFGMSWCMLLICLRKIVERIFLK